jgi:uncharacterized protein YbcV (DUF1398 family)
MLHGVQRGGDDRPVKRAHQQRQSDHNEYRDSARRIGVSR